MNNFNTETRTFRHFIRRLFRDTDKVWKFDPHIFCSIDLLFLWQR